jgi:hypothetical protein
MLTPPRWLRFRLSTVLILTAIAAWAMALRPSFYVSLVHNVGAGPPNWQFALGTHSPNSDGLWVAWFGGAKGTPSPGRVAALVQIGPQPALQWPVLALAAFIAWKAGWAIVARRRARPESACTR